MQEYIACRLLRIDRPKKGECTKGYIPSLYGIRLVWRSDWAVFKSDWSRAGLCIDLLAYYIPIRKLVTKFEQFNRFECCDNGNTRRKTEVHRKQYSVKTCNKIFRKCSGMLEKR